MSAPGQLAGKTAIVTGAAGALGSAIATRFVAEGVSAIAVVDLDRERIDAAAAALTTSAVPVIPVALDVTDHDAVLHEYAQVAKLFRRIDVAVNNAGIVAPSARIHNTDPAAWQRVLDVNLTGIFNTMKASIVAMRATGGGSIVNTGSVAGFTNWTHNSPYGASKAAVIQLTKIAAAEYAKEHIRVNCVSPGTFVTGFHDDLPDGALDSVLARHPLGRFGLPEEIASAYVYLAGDQADWVTGTSMVIDGGMSVGS